jgi:hypothetical protein
MRGPSVLRQNLWPDFIEGSIHIIAELFDQVISGDKKRIIINMPPRHKSELLRLLSLPAAECSAKVIQSSHTANWRSASGARSGR